MSSRSSPAPGLGSAPAFVDTDVIIRLLTGDDPAKQAAASALFERVEEGSLTLKAPDTVIADAVYVLSSPRLYRQPRRAIAAQLSALVSLPAFAVENRARVLAALELYAGTSLDFADALLVASMQGQGAPVLYSYDADFDRVPGVKRQEP
jgi:predicted nucleic acid-binding protein